MKTFSFLPIFIAAWNIPPGWIERKNEFMRRVNGQDPMGKKFLTTLDQFQLFQGWWMKPASYPLQEDKHAQLKQEAERKMDLYGAIDLIKETELIKVCCWIVRTG